jgi:hypothetical protein
MHNFSLQNYFLKHNITLKINNQIIKNDTFKIIFENENFLN